MSVESTLGASTHPCQPSPRQLPLGAQTLAALAADVPFRSRPPPPGGLMLMPPAAPQPTEDEPPRSLLAHDCWRGNDGMGGELSWDRPLVVDARIGTGDGCDMQRRVGPTPC